MCRHLFVALGSCFHWFLVYIFILKTDISLKDTLGESISDTLSTVIDTLHNLSTSDTLNNVIDTLHNLSTVQDSL